MTWMMLRRTATCTLFTLVAGCGALDVSDPTAIEDTDLANATGADLLRRDAWKKLYVAVSGGVLASGLLADELLVDPPAINAQLGVISAEEQLDRRRSEEYEVISASEGGSSYRDWLAARHAATLTLSQLHMHAPESRARLGEMFAVRGFATLRLAEDYCPGFPLNTVVDYATVYGQPLSTDEVFAHALADFDSALAYAADSARILHLAQVGRARVLLGLGRFAEAADAAAPVPDGYVWHAEFSSTGDVDQWNRLGERWARPDLTLGVADGEGSNGLNFVSAGDPRVKTMSLGTAQNGDSIYAATMYANRGSPIVLASAIEARLIEAEVALRANDPATWLAKLNQLRQTAIVPALSDTTDPGTDVARQDLLFRERAFWLFATGHRLGDLRRLVRHYGRSSEDVFPTGSYWLGGLYAAATSIPFPAALETPLNPAVTGCTSR